MQKIQCEIVQKVVEHTFGVPVGKKIFNSFAALHVEPRSAKLVYLDRTESYEIYVSLNLFGRQLVWEWRTERAYDLFS